MKNNSNLQEIVVEVSEKEFNLDLQRGLESDEVLHPGQHRFKRGGFLARHGLAMQKDVQTQVRVTITLDADVVAYFRQLAKQERSTSFHNEVNHALREVMQQRSTIAA